MAFTVARGALHRPLGFSAATGVVASGSADGPCGVIAVERCAADQQGATAALLAPPDAHADAANRAARLALAEGLGEVSGVLVAAASIALLVGSAQRQSPADLARLRSGATGEGFAPLAAALADRGVPAALASTRGIVDGELVSLLGLASGRMRPGARSPLRLTVLTDARLDRATLAPLLRESAEQALANVAGLATPLPGDGVLALANGLAQSARIEVGSLGFGTLRVGTTALLQELLRELLEKAWLPAAACLVQLSVVGGRDGAEAAEQCEALARSDELARVVAEALLSPSAAPAARIGRFAVRRAKRGEQLAVALELGRGRSGATRWIALPR